MSNHFMSYANMVSQNDHYNPLTGGFGHRTIIEKTHIEEGDFLIDNKKVKVVDTTPLRQFINRPISKFQITECVRELKDS